MNDVFMTATLVAIMNTSTDLATLFFGSYRRQVLGLLLLRPDEAFHLREIARVTHTQPGTLRRELNLLADAGVLLRERLGNLVRYRANPACPIYEELRGILKKTSGMADVLREALRPLAGRIRVALLFGSVAKDEEGRESDIDLLVVGTVTFDEVVDAVYSIQQQLGREINPVVYTPQEFAKKRSGAFLKRVLEDRKLFILGTENDIGKSGADRKAAAT